MRNSREVLTDFQETATDAQHRYAAVLRGVVDTGPRASGSTPARRPSTCAARSYQGLYACGDSADGFGQHGICRAATFGRIAGFHAAQQQS
jgi:hypothetical protein